MSRYDALNPQGPLSIITAATVAPAAVQLYAPTPAQNQAGIFAPDCVEITNAGSTDAFLCHATTAVAAAAIATAGIPTAGVPTSGMIHIPAGADKVYTLRADEYYTAITASGTAVLYLLPGRGN